MPAIGEIDENREERRWEVGCPILIAANKDFFPLIFIIVEEEEDKEDLPRGEDDDSPRWTDTGQEEFIIALCGYVYKCDSKVVFFLK